jgi:hypothetical protein
MARPGGSLGGPWVVLAGHGVGYLVPYQPVWAERASPQDSGAAVDANPDAAAQLWPRLLQFLAGSAPAR